MNKLTRSDYQQIASDNLAQLRYRLDFDNEIPYIEAAIPANFSGKGYGGDLEKSGLVLDYNTRTYLSSNNNSLSSQSMAKKILNLQQKWALQQNKLLIYFLKF